MSNEATPAIRYERDADGIVTLTMDDPTAGANTMNEIYTQAKAEVLDRLAAEIDDVIGVVLTSGKKTFFAGGDLNRLVAVGPEQAGELFEEVQRIKGVLRRLETIGKPTVAAINGAALGGGLEVALACQHRIAVDHPSVQIGFPEVTLGLLPGGGGVTRTVRMLGIQTALMDWLLQGQRRGPAEAMKKGLIDGVVPTQEELIPAAKQWILDHQDDPKACQKPWDVKGFKIPGGTPSDPRFAANLPSFPANVRKQLKGADYPAPKAILAAAIEGSQVDFETASRIETRYFVELATGRVATNMIQAFFFDMQAISGGSLRPKGIDKTKVRRVGVLGAGMMGAGIAYSCAKAGIEVVLKDVSREAAEKGKAYSDKLLSKAVDRGRLSMAEREAVLERIHPTDAAADLAGVDAIIEAVFEDARLKAKVFGEAEEVLGGAGSTALLCSNTSTLPISELAGAVTRPADFVGLHFFSPVDKMKLVEIIVGTQTSDAALARAIDIVQQIKKVPIVVNDSRGFYTSRVFGKLIIEGAAMIGEGIDPMVVERAATMAGFPAPPLAMLDEVSLTLTQHIRAEAEKAAAAAGQSLAPEPGTDVIDRMVGEFGRAGRAKGAGFYDYPEGAPKKLWPGLREHFTKDVEVPLADLKDRFLFAMALESAKCIEEGVLTSAPSANIGSILGIGFPPLTGGTAQFMTNYAGGLQGFVDRAKELAASYGDRFEPSPWLVERASSGRGLF